MTRRLFCCSLSCSVLGLALPSLAQRTADRPVPIMSSREADTYAIWSLLLPILQQPQKQYMIPDVTLAPGWNAYPQTPVERQDEAGLAPVQRALLYSSRGIWIEVPEDRRQQFREAALDYAVSSYGRVEVKPKFALAKPVHLMNVSEVETYHGPFSAISQVYFDNTQTLGIVWAEKIFGCGEISWYVFEKKDDDWKHAAWKSDSIEECA